MSLPAIVTSDLRLNSRGTTLPNIMKAKKKPLDKVTPADLGVDVAPRLKTLKVAEPAGRKAGIKSPTWRRWSTSSGTSQGHLSALSPTGGRTRGTDQSRGWISLPNWKRKNLDRPLIAEHDNASPQKGDPQHRHRSRSRSVATSMCSSPPQCQLGRAGCRPDPGRGQRCSTPTARAAARPGRECRGAGFAIAGEYSHLLFRNGGERSYRAWQNSGGARSSRDHQVSL